MLSMHVEEEAEKHNVSQRIIMNYYALILTCSLSNSLFGMQKVRYSETLVPGGRSEITSYLHILPKDVEELVAQLLIHAHPALFPPVSRVLSGHTGLISSVALTPDGRWALTGSHDKTARLWDLSNPGSSPRVLSGHMRLGTLSSNHTRWQVGLNGISR